MFVRTLDELERLGRIKIPADKSFCSARFLTAADGMGFSYNENGARESTDLVVWPKHHWKGNHVISGSGEVTDIGSGRTWQLGLGMAYGAGPKDRHRLRAHADMHILSVTCPPPEGRER